MKKFIALLAFTTALSAPARASEISIKLSDGTQNALVQLPAVFDQCIANLTLRGDAAVCKNISNFLVGVSNEVKAEAAIVAKAEADKAAAAKATTTTPPAPAAAKK